MFTHEDVGRYDTCYKTLPPLRDQSDVDALIAAVNDGTIDCIVSEDVYKRQSNSCSVMAWGVG